MVAVLTGLILALAAVFNALMDLSSEDRFSSLWLNKSTGWKFKWKDGDPEKGERFLLSSTVLVFLTDGWHLFQFLFHSSWQAAIAINMDNSLISFVILKSMFSLIFEIVYRDGRKSKNQRDN